MTNVRTFSGFPAATFRFFDELSKNNNRDWFGRNKGRYQKDVVEPAVTFVESLGPRLTREVPGMTFDPGTSGSGSLQRIYRDIRFSRDKSPYKTYLGIRFWYATGGGRGDGPGYYVHLDSSGVRVYAGKHAFERDLLDAFRSAVLDEKSGSELEQIVNRLESGGFEVGGARFKRVPAGIDPGHPRARFLKFNTLYAASPKVQPHATDLVDVCENACLAMRGLNDWIKSLGSRRAASPARARR